MLQTPLTDLERDFIQRTADLRGVHRLREWRRAKAHWNAFGFLIPGVMMLTLPDVREPRASAQGCVLPHYQHRYAPVR